LATKDLIHAAASGSKRRGHAPIVRLGDALLDEILRSAQNDGRKAPPFQRREGWATRKRKSADGEFSIRRPRIRAPQFAGTNYL
jgi:hypothetical protein